MKKSIISLVASLTIASSLSLADDTIYATVNGDNITGDDIAVALRDPRIQFESLPDDAKKQVINQVVEKKLLSEKAVKSGVEKQEQYKEALEKIKKDLALEIWMQNEYKKIDVTNKELKEFYNKNIDKFKTNETLEARHILVENEKDAKAIISELDKAKDKQAKFIELAKSKSTGPTGKDGGYLGKFTAEQMVPEFSQAASALKPKTYTKKPVKTQFGYHVIYLEGAEKESTLSFDDVKAKIKPAVMQEKFKDKIKDISDELKKKAKIEIK